MAIAANMAVIDPIIVPAISAAFMVELLSSARLWIGIARADSNTAASIGMPIFRTEYMLNVLNANIT